MAIMRTVDGACEYFRGKDPNTAINPTMLRRLIKEQKIKYVKVGAKFLINIDWLEGWLQNPIDVVEQPKNTGVLRKIM